MAQKINRYKADLREIRFTLFELLEFGDVLGKPPFAEWGAEEVDMVLTEANRYATEVAGPLNELGDEQGCRVENGQVKVPEGFKQAWDALYEAGWKGLSISSEFGGQEAPFLLHTVVEEFLSGSNVSLSMYPGLTSGAAEVIAQFGTDAQKKKYVERMFSGEWGGTMCLTEPQAGTDVGASRTVAKKRSDGKYDITGTKMYISAGDHDMVDNIIHLVLARIEGAPAGTKGLSLFIIPKLDTDTGESNDVTVASIEHKMGINGSATCLLNFGESGKCMGELVGSKENVGMSQMFHLMNAARISVATQGLGVASTAFLNALEYAKERKQGPHISNWKDASAPRVAIIEHPDVRRMLLDMKARVEGIRALVYKLALHLDRAALADEDEAVVKYHRGQIELLTPVVKAYASDQAFAVCETAIQTYGGAGYLRDHPVEQYCRDSKIFSIYEGTNHIQAMDLVGRKLPMGGGENFRSFLGDVGKFVTAHKEHPTLGSDVQALGKASEAMGGAAMQLLGWFQAGKMTVIPLYANRFLEMLAETGVAWLLLEGAVKGDAAMAKLPEGHDDRDFYLGKRAAAQYFARNVLPSVTGKAKVLRTADTSALEIPDAGFSSMS